MTKESDDLMAEERKRIIIAGEKSGCGKTSVSTVIIRSLAQAGYRVRSFKCGPDYIDPSYHEAAGAVRGANLDSYFMDSRGLGALIGMKSDPEDICVIEGVMGYYDGIGLTDRASTYEVACLTRTCVIMVMDASGSSQTVLARLKGLLDYRKDLRIRGVVFNRLAGKLYPGLEKACEDLGISCIGYVGFDPEAVFESRHLGLVIPGEAEGVDEKIGRLSRGANIDISRLMELTGPSGEIVKGGKESGCGSGSYEISGQLQAHVPVGYEQTHEPVGSGQENHVPGGYVQALPDVGNPDSESVQAVPDVNSPDSESVQAVPDANSPDSESAHEDLLFGLKDGFRGVRLGIARDEAFSFHYSENLELLKYMGCELVFFSPVHDELPPPDIDGLILCGGYPEEYAPALEAGEPMRQRIRELIKQGLPTIAECGGFMYLHRAIRDRAGKRYEMCGVIDGECSFTGRLSHFGYQKLKIKADNPLAAAGDEIKAHEFHRSVSTAVCNGAVAYKASDIMQGGKCECWDSLVVSPTLFSGYAHVHFFSDPAMAVRFLRLCLKNRNPG